MQQTRRVWDEYEFLCSRQSRVRLIQVAVPASSDRQDLCEFTDVREEPTQRWSAILITFNHCYRPLSCGLQV